MREDVLVRLADGVLGRFAISEHTTLAVFAETRFEIHELASQRAAHRAAALGLLAKPRNLYFELRCEFVALARILLERARNFGVLDERSGGSKVGLTVATTHEQMVERAQD